MNTVSIASIAITPDKGLLLRPHSGHSYDRIYRAGNGLRWSREDTAIMAYEPHRWNPAELFKHILITVAAECYDKLALTPETQWEDVGSTVKAEIEHVLKELKL